MKLYTDLDIPLWRWDKIQESQKDGELDLRWLCIDTLPKKYNKEEYYDAYLNILYQIPEIDLSLNNAWIAYIAELMRYNIINEMNLWIKKFKFWFKVLYPKKNKEIKQNINKLNKTFNNYLTELENNYKEFEFDVHFLKKDYREKWNLDINIPDELIKNEKMEFFLADEYLFMIKAWIKDSKITFNEGLHLITPEFYERFIDVKKMKISNLKKVDEMLYEKFRDAGEIEKWRIIRGDFFNLNKLDFTTKKENNILKQLIRLREINKQAIPLKGDNACTLKEYFEQIERAREKEKEAKKREHGK
jgi:hypothetical protein